METKIRSKMKKDNLTLLLAAAAMLAACSKTDTYKEVDTPDVAIGFNGEYVSKTTKAEITDAWMTAANTVFPDYDFGVYGYKQESDNTSNGDALTDASPLFNNEQVTMGSNAGVRTNWVHSTVRYWDKGLTKGATAADLKGYYFYAYAPYQASTTFNKTAGFTYQLGSQIFADATTATTYTTGNITAGTIDLCVADAVEKTDYATHHYVDEQGRVSFTFKHVLSKLTLKVKKGGNIDAGHEVTLTSLYVGFPTTTGGVVWTQTARNAYNGTVTYGATYTAAASASTQITIANQSVSSDAKPIYTAVPTVEPEFAGTTINSYIVTPNANKTNADDKHAIQIKVGYTIDYNDDPDGNGNHDDDTMDHQIATGVASIHFVENNHYILTIIINPATIEFDIEDVPDFTVVNGQTIDVN